MSCSKSIGGSSSILGWNHPTEDEDDDEYEDDLLAAPVLFRIQDRLPGLRPLGRDSLASDLYLPEKKPKAYGGQNS